mgnify:CR=1 FL=1
MPEVKKQQLVKPTCEIHGVPEGRVEGYSVPRLADQGTGHHLSGCQVPKHTIAIRNSPDITFVVYPNQNVSSKTMAKKR